MESDGRLISRLHAITALTVIITNKILIPLIIAPNGGGVATDLDPSYRSGLTKFSLRLVQAPLSASSAQPLNMQPGQGVVLLLSATPLVSNQVSTALRSMSCSIAITYSATAERYITLSGIRRLLEA